MSGEATLAWVAEALAPHGHVSHRRMMGGWTLYLDAVIFALIDRDGGLWFKSDAVSDPAWDAAGCERFGYDQDGKSATMNDRRAPDATYDDAEELARCALLGVDAGLRGARKQPRR
ncbi:TfoX/Sxy family protein [Sphingomonas hominis]